MSHLLKSMPATAVAAKPPFQGAKIEILALPRHLQGPNLIPQAKILAATLGYPVELARQTEDDGKILVLSFGRSTAYAEVFMRFPADLAK